MITYICGSMIKYSQFPDAFWKEVFELMEKGDEILLGNSDFDHRVYNRIRNKQYKNVSVMCDSLKKEAFGSQIESVLPSYISMLRKCDRMITIWDGESQEAFINILLLLALNKKCRMYYLPSGECVEISSADEFAEYVLEREGWTSEDMREVLIMCGFEEQMTSYLTKDGPLSESLITDIISKAPVNIDKKRDMLEKLQRKNNLNYEAFGKVSLLIEKGSDFELINDEMSHTFSFGSFISRSISDINWAKYFLKNGTYYLFMEWYDTDVFIEKSSPVGMFKSLKNVMKYIEREETCTREDDDGDKIVDWWYRLEVWSDLHGSWGSENIHEYNFYIYEGEVCWFERMREDKQDNGVVYYLPENKEFYGGWLDLSFPTPFKLGDIVNIDCTPFGTPFHALITEAEHQFDCCMPQVLFKIPYTDRWAISALKHKHFYKEAEGYRYEPVLSPLYRLRLVREEELTEEDDLLVIISRELKNEETGYEFGSAFNDQTGEGISAEEVMKVWELVKKDKGFDRQ